MTVRDWTPTYAGIGVRRRLRAWWSHLKYPALSWCLRCGLSWGAAHGSGHATDYRSGHGCFPLCEICWADLTPTERLPYYDRLVDNWVTDPAATDEHRAQCELDRVLIRRAVEAGG